MHGITELGALVGCFFGGRAYQWMRDRQAMKVSRTIAATFDTVADIAAQRRRAERHITREQNRKG